MSDVGTSVGTALGIALGTSVVEPNDEPLPEPEAEDEAVSVDGGEAARLARLPWLATHPRTVNVAKRSKAIGEGACLRHAGPWQRERDFTQSFCDKGRWA